MARAAPSATSASTGPGLRECTVSGNPASRRCRAMGAPMMPSPMNPTRSPMGRRYASTAASAISSARSMISKPSVICSSVMGSGGFVISVHQWTIV